MMASIVSRREAIQCLLSTVVAFRSALLRSAPVDDHVDPTSWTLVEAAERLRAGRVSSTELVGACLRRIDRLEPRLHTFTRVFNEDARRQAKARDDEMACGTYHGPLHGIPIALKDLIDVHGVPTTAASRVLLENVAARDARVVTALKAAGAVILGKSNMHECAYGGSSVVSAFGAVRNPWNPDRIAGGSSGGSAAALAARFCYGCIGTDTAGSIRQPAGYCGVVGFKPSYRDVSTEGIFPLSSTLDHAGPLARTVGDTRILFAAISSRRAPEFPPGCPSWINGRRLGRVVDLWRGLDQSVAAAAETALRVLERLTGAKAVDVKNRLTDGIFAGRRNPVRAATIATFREAFLTHREALCDPKRTHLYQPSTRTRLLLGERVSNRQYQDAVKTIHDIRRSVVDDFFGSADYLISPTAPIEQPAAADCRVSELKELQALRNTMPFNVLGVPTISVPAGFTPDRLPIGLQIAGRPDDDWGVLDLALALECEAPWFKERPPLEE